MTSHLLLPGSQVGHQAAQLTLFGDPSIRCPPFRIVFRWYLFVSDGVQRGYCQVGGIGTGKQGGSAVSTIWEGKEKYVLELSWESAYNLHLRKHV